MGTRVLSLWLPYFAIDRIEHERAVPATGLRPRRARPASWTRMIDRSPPFARSPNAPA